MGHEGSSVSSGKKYLLRTEVVYASPETSEIRKEAARLRGLARQLGGLGGKDLLEGTCADESEVPEPRQAKKRKIRKDSLKEKNPGKYEGTFGKRAAKARKASNGKKRRP